MQSSDFVYSAMQFLFIRATGWFDPVLCSLIVHYSFNANKIVIFQKKKKKTVANQNIPFTEKTCIYHYFDYVRKCLHMRHAYSETDFPLLDLEPMFSVFFFFHTSA